jgi:cellulose synthase/poly-beta-1,6-N-acetylglucosamine synthase-like glycosyltransferase
VVLSVVCGVRLGKDFYVLVIGVYFVVFLEFWFVIVEIGIYIYIYIVGFADLACRLVWKPKYVLIGSYIPNRLCCWDLVEKMWTDLGLL